MHTSIFPQSICILTSGAELKKMFMDAGGNFELVEMKVKKWITNKASKEETNSRVTKPMLKEKYFWDEAVPKFPNMHAMHDMEFSKCVVQDLAHVHTCMHIYGELSSMIENTWKWAAENNKIIKHPISGGEFVDVDVESLSKRIHEEGSNMTQTAGGLYEALNRHPQHVCNACMFECRRIQTQICLGCINI